MAREKSGDMRKAYEIVDDNASNNDLYAAWASSYDADTKGYGYVGPMSAARVLARFVAPATAKVIDIGCGTGLVGEALAGLGFRHVDGTDISSDMIAVARGKGHYRDLSVDDLLERLHHATGAYDAAVAVGTFGPVSPRGLPECERVVRPGGILCLSVNEIWYESRGFAEEFRAMERAGRVDILEVARHPHVTEADHDAYIAVLRKR